MPRVAGSPIESTFTLADGVCVSNVWQTPGFLVHLDELFNEFSRCIVKIDRHSLNRARALGHDFATLDARKIKFHYRLIALDRVITK